MICHAPPTATLTVRSLALAVIGPDSGILLVSPVRSPPLFAPHPPATGLSAVGLAAVTRPADEEHHTTSRTAAKQLTKDNFSGHRTPQTGVDNGRHSWHPDLGTEVRFLCRNRPETKAPIAPTIGAFYVSAPALPYQSLRFATAMMMTITPARVQKTSLFSDRLHAARVREVVTPYAHNGSVRYEVHVDVAWGVPDPRNG